jgi:hypothetical protein
MNRLQEQCGGNLCPGYTGIRYVGGVSMSWALKRNVRTCRRDDKGKR